MIIIKTMSEKNFVETDLTSVLRIDLILFILLIGLLIFKGFLNLYINQSSLKQLDTDLNMGRINNIVIIPFLYIFIYVLIFKLLNSIY